MSTGQSFEEFSRSHDLHNLSHRTLVRELIPRWLSEGELDLDGRIVSAAYGETPCDLRAKMIEQVSLRNDDILLDLGAGAGGLVGGLLQDGFRAYGIEQNSGLVQAGKNFFSQLDVPETHLILGDFLQCAWPEASVVFSTTSRFSEGTLLEAAARIEACPGLRAVVTLGRPISLSGRWNLTHQSSHSVSWNHQEPPVEERLSVHKLRREGPVAPPLL